MKWHPSASPARPAPSELKKRVLANLQEQSKANKQQQVQGSSQQQHVHINSQNQARRQQLQAGKAQQEPTTSRAQAQTQLGAPPYSLLDAAVAHGPLAAHLQVCCSLLPLVSFTLRFHSPFTGHLPAVPLCQIQGSASLQLQEALPAAASRRGRGPTSQSSGPGRGDQRWAGAPIRFVVMLSCLGFHFRS